VRSILYLPFLSPWIAQFWPQLLVLLPLNLRRNGGDQPNRVTRVECFDDSIVSAASDGPHAMVNATQLPVLDEADPTFLVKARADKCALRAKQPGHAQDAKYGRQFRKQLARLGCEAVDREWSVQLPVMSWSDPFRAVVLKGRSPSMGFVREWIACEKKRQQKRKRLTMWTTMLAVFGAAAVVAWSASLHLAGL
jgi:hypothetical protein